MSVSDLSFSPLIFALDEKKKPYAVVDGKQRFEALFDFYGGNIALDRNFLYTEDPTLSLGGLGFKDLKGLRLNPGSILL